MINNAELQFGPFTESMSKGRAWSVSLRDPKTLCKEEQLALSPRSRSVTTNEPCRFLVNDNLFGRFK